MRTYDKSFGIIVRTRGDVLPQDLAAAEEELEERLGRGEDITLARLLTERGKVDASKVSAIETAMRRHALECTACGATTYLLPRQDEKSVRCEACGAATRRPSLARALSPRASTARVPTTDAYARAAIGDAPAAEKRSAPPAPSWPPPPSEALAVQVQDAPEVPDAPRMAPAAAAPPAWASEAPVAPPEDAPVPWPAPPEPSPTAESPPPAERSPPPEPAPARATSRTSSPTSRASAPTTARATPAPGSRATSRTAPLAPKLTTTSTSEPPPPTNRFAPKPEPTFVPAAAATAMLAAEGDQSLLGKINKVPRVVWIACSVISLIVAYQAISTTMRLVNYESAIGEEIMKLNRFGVDIRGKTLEILKKDGITPKPEEIQLVIYQNIQKDARVWAYATVRSPQIHIQAQKRLTTKESIDIAIASGFELVYNDASKVWPDGPGAGRQLRIFFGFLFMVVFAAMAYTLGKG